MIKVLITAGLLVATLGLWAGCASSGEPGWKGNVQVITNSDGTLYRFSGTRPKVVILDHLMLEPATILRLFRDTLLSCEYLEKLTGWPLNDPVFIQTESKSSVSRAGEFITLQFWKRSYYLPILTHELAHHYWFVNHFLSEGFAYLVQDLFHDRIVIGDSNRDAYLYLAMSQGHAAATNRPASEYSPWIGAEYSLLFLQTAIISGKYIALGSCISNFKKEYFKGNLEENWSGGGDAARTFRAHFFVDMAKLLTEFMVERKGYHDWIRDLGDGKVAGNRDENRNYARVEDVGMKDLEHFYGKPMGALETDFTNWVMRHPFRNVILRDLPYRNSLKQVLSERFQKISNQ